MIDLGWKENETSMIIDRSSAIPQAGTEVLYISEYHIKRFKVEMADNEYIHLTDKTSIRSDSMGIHLFKITPIIKQHHDHKTTSDN